MTIIRTINNTSIHLIIRSKILRYGDGCDCVDIYKIIKKNEFKIKLIKLTMNIISHEQY
jgi:hypothetical protein